MLEVAKMNAAKGEDRCFLRQRRAGIIAIAAAMPVALLLWLAIAYFMPPLAGMDTLADRMLFALKCCCIAVLFVLQRAWRRWRMNGCLRPPLTRFQGLKRSGCG
jgi:hypothetical protein